MEIKTVKCKRCLGTGWIDIGVSKKESNVIYLLENGKGLRETMRATGFKNPGSISHIKNKYNL